MIAGHTKFSPDLIFSKIAKTYNQSDVFTTTKLKDLISRYADVTVDEGSIVCDWRNAMTKYSKLPGIGSLHDFIFVKNSVTGSVVAKVHDLCYTGSFTNAAIWVLPGKDASGDVIPNHTKSYASLNKTRSLSLK